MKVKWQCGYYRVDGDGGLCGMFFETKVSWDALVWDEDESIKAVCPRCHNVLTLKESQPQILVNE